MGNSEVKKAKELTLSEYIKTPKPQSFLKTVFSDPKKLEAFATSTIIAVSTNPDLAKCTPQSLLNCALQIENLGLSLSTQDCYIVPYKTKDKNGNIYYLATLQISYKGYQRLFQRSGLAKKLIITEVKEGEFVSWNRFTEEFIYNVLDDDEREDKKTVGFYIDLVTKSGFEKKMYWTVKKMEKHADKYSSAFSLKTYKEIQEGKIPQKELWKYSTPWYREFDKMGNKTMIRQLMDKWGDLTPTMRTAMAFDGAAIENDSGTLKPVYIDTTAEDVEPTNEPASEPAQVPDMPEQTEEPEDIGLDDL